MKINRVWAMSNSHTFSIPPIRELIDRYVGWGDVIVDPFANDSTIGTITNDLNPKFDTDYHMDALDFLKSIDTAYADVVLYDPPYSPRQVKECYDSIGLPLTAEETRASWRSRHLDEIARILKPGGFALSFGWNSNGLSRCWLSLTAAVKMILFVPWSGSSFYNPMPMLPFSFRFSLS